MSTESPPLGTSAPEVDAMEALSTPASASLIPNDSSGPAQTGASMGDHCTTDRPTNSHLSPAGTMSEISNIAVYITKPPTYPQTPARLLLLLTGGTGVSSRNNQLQADKYATAGNYVVVMPDQFSGDPAPNSTNTSSSTEAGEVNASLIEQVKLGLASTAKSFLLDMWLARHTPETVLPTLHTVVEAIRDEYADAVAFGGGIYGVGYCFGARYVLILAGEGALVVDEAAKKKAEGDVETGTASKAPLLKAAAVAHGTLVTREDVGGVKIPVCLICCENDQLFPVEILDAGRTQMESNAVEHEITTYPGVPHGFAVVGEYSDSKIQEAQGRAFEQMLGWLKAH